MEQDGRAEQNATSVGDEGVWPERYEPPTLEVLGPVWEHTGAVIGTGSDGTLNLTA